MKFKTAMDKEKTRTIDLEFEVGSSLEEMVELFTEAIVFEKAADSIIIALQDNIRRLMRAGKSDAEIEEFVATWKPGTRSARVARAMTPDEMLKAIEKLPEEMQARLLEKLMNK